MSPKCFFRKIWVTNSWKTKWLSLAIITRYNIELGFYPPMPCSNGHVDESPEDELMDLLSCHRTETWLFWRHFVFPTFEPTKVPLCTVHWFQVHIYTSLFHIRFFHYKNKNHQISMTIYIIILGMCVFPVGLLFSPVRKLMALMHGEGSWSSNVIIVVIVVMVWWTGMIAKKL